MKGNNIIFPQYIGGILSSSFMEKKNVKDHQSRNDKGETKVQHKETRESGGSHSKTSS